MKDLALGELGLSVDELNSMTWGNFQRHALGYIKRTWTVSREILAAVYSHGSGKPVKGEDVFPFGVTDVAPPPSKEDREYMKKRRANTKKIMNNVRG